MMTVSKSTSASMDEHISYDVTAFNVGPGIDIKDFKLNEDWDCRPASEWSVQKIGLLESKIESFTYQIYHSNRYGKHNLSKVIPGFKLVQFANESFGYDGWFMDVVDIEVTDCVIIPSRNPEHTGKELDLGLDPNEDEDVKYNVMAEAQVKITLRDGTNTQMGGIGRATLPNKGMSFAKAKKEAINDALKKSLLSFEKIIMEYNEKVEKKYYVDGLYVSKIKQENSNPLGISLQDTPAPKSQIQ